MSSVDVFAYHPIPFAELHSRAERMVIDGVLVYICSIDDLITLKKQAGRAQGLVDIEKLRRIQEKRKSDCSGGPAIVSQLGMYSSDQWGVPC